MQLPGNQFSDGALVHIVNRGNNQQPIFHSDEDYRWFTRKAVMLFENSKMKMVAYCLMPNHFHFFLQVSSAGDLSKYFQRLQLSYSKHFNRKYNLRGHLFEGNYRSIAISDEHHAIELVRYIFNNPVKSGLAIQPQDWEYSNYKNILSEIGVVQHFRPSTFLTEVFGTRAEFEEYLQNISDEFSRRLPTKLQLDS